VQGAIIIPIPIENLSKVCEDFTASQGSADDAGQEGPLGYTGKKAGRPQGGFPRSGKC